MARWVLELIKEEMYQPDLPDYVLMNRDDVLFLLEIISVSEEMANLTDHSALRGSKVAQRLISMWRELLAHEV